MDLGSVILRGGSITQWLKEANRRDRQARWHQEKIDKGLIRRCAICQRYVSGYGLKKLPDGNEICRKGLCRKIYDSNYRDLEECKSMYDWSKSKEMKKNE